MKPLYFLVSIFFLTHNTLAYATEIIAALNEGRAGEQSHVIGMMHALVQKDPHLKFMQITHNNIELLEPKIVTLKENSEPLILLASGEAGINFLEKAHQLTQRLDFNNGVYCHSSHMILQNHQNLFGFVQFIVLPEYAVSADFTERLEHYNAHHHTNTQLVLTNGVPHPVNAEKIANEHHAYIKKFKWLRDTKHVILLYLGGDAPDESGQMKFYSSEEACQTAHHIALQAQMLEAKVMVFNGPRTGAFDPLTSQKREFAHKNGDIDPVTRAAMEVFKKMGISENVQLYNFEFGTPSLYLAALGFLKNLKGIDYTCYLPGESSSVITETNDVLLGSTIIVTNSAMNPIHLKHVACEQFYGRSKIVDQTLNFISLDSRNCKKQLMPHNAAEQAAEQILNFLKTH